MKAKMNLNKLLSMLLALVMVAGMLPAMSQVAYAYSEGQIAGTTGSGASEHDPVVCDTFAEFKAAMENTEITYVKLTGASGAMPSRETLGAAISNTTYKVLTIEGTNKFWSPLNGMNDCLIWPRANLTINGTGTLKYEHGNTGGTGAVINMASNVKLTINGNVTLEGGANGTSYGYAISAQAGTTVINGGSFIGYNAFITNNADVSAVIISHSANLTINGGNFSASLHQNSPEGKKAHSLSITSTATGAISIKEGTFPQGINIKASGKTIENCGYFDTAKASITAGGNPVKAAASTDVLKNTEVIVTDTSVIGSVTVAVTTPVAGAAPAAPTTSTANVTVSNYMWTIRPEGSGISSFEAGKTYRCQVILNPASGYTFKSNATVTIGGQTATIDSQSTTGIIAHVDFTPPVSSVAISVTAPTAGATPSAPTTSTANVSIVVYQWKTSGGTVLNESATFEAGNTYRLEMTINPTTGHTLSDTATATVNGNTATVTRQDTSYLSCKYEFTVPAASTPTTIDTVDVTITEPVAGAHPQEGVSSTDNVKVSITEWYHNGVKMSSSDTFVARDTYKVHVIVVPDGQSLFTDSPTVTFNGSKPGTVYLNGSDYINYYAEFTVPAASHTHTYDQEIVKTEALKTAADCTHYAVYYKSCSCGAISTNDADTFTDAGSALSHAWPKEESWSKDADKHWHECSRCHEKKDEEAHIASDWITDTAATATTDGTKHKECNVCHRVLETGTIPATGSGSSGIIIFTYYTLTFDTNGGSSISKITKIKGTTVDLEKYEPTKEGYEFTGWYSDKELTDEITSIKLTNNTTVYAGWEAIKENPSTGAFPFVDVDTDDWFFEDVAYVYDNGLMNGVGDNLFAPEISTDRAMIVTILWRMEGCPVVNYAMNFTDVQEDQWYTEAIRWAEATGIVNGYGNGLFGTTDPITLEQAAAILYRYAAYKGWTDDTTVPILPAYTYSEWAENDVIWAELSGIFSGVGTELDDLTTAASRAEIASFLHRFCEDIAK